MTTASRASARIFRNPTAWLIVFAIVAGAGLGSIPSSKAAADSEVRRVDQPNYEQALKYSTEYLRQFVYDTAVTPHWVGKTDVFWYSYRTSAGTHWYRVNPRLAIKEPLFDCMKLGAQLSEMVQKPLDCAQLPLTRESMNDEGSKFRFVVDEYQYEYDLTSEKLTKTGRAPAAPAFGAGQGRGGFGRGNLQQFQQQVQQQIQQLQQNQNQNQNEQQNQQVRQNNNQEQQNTTQQQTGRRGRGFGGRGGRGGAVAGRGGPTTRPNDYRNMSPDGSMYVYAYKHNLYLVVLKDAKKAEEKKSEETKKLDESAKSDETKSGDAKKSDETKSDDAKKDDEKKDDAKKDEEKKQEPKRQPASRPDPEANAIQLTSDGAEDFDFSGGFGRGRGGVGQNNNTNNQNNNNQQNDANREERKTRPNVTWSKDSKSFFVTRTDTRGVQELWVMNSLSQPRPTIEKYKYSMPGEEAVPKTELFVFSADSKKLKRIPPKWFDEGYGNVHFGKTGDDLRFIRHDRPLRHDDLVTYDVKSGNTKTLITEGFQNANLVTENVTYVEGTDEMIWWSERSGWGHYYLYDHEGNLKNPITSGTYRASSIVDIDTKKRVMYFIANGREPGENVYYEHLYRVHLDGTDLVLMDPGNATHRSILSPTKNFLVDNWSRVDGQPASYLRDAGGHEVLELEKSDLSQLQAVGWKMPETFTVKAADGVTDLYGNMWKPFDFDPHKKYPIIAHVYPGPQMEGTTYTFSATAAEQQLAQVGFIVIQVGHRGGSPQRSKAYGSYGYFNLRDYGLADKKATLEQLAARFSYIDIDRVGIYGHSGGGFMTAAAMLQKPYNTFFKVGVSESGNHDNNIYNQGWSERYHGLKEVVITGDGKSQSRDASAAGSGNNSNGNGAEQTNGELHDYGGGADDEAWQKTDWLSWLAHQQSGSDALGNPISPAADDDEKKTDDSKKTTDSTKKSDKSSEEQKQEQKVKFEIHVPTNVELASNLRGHLLLIHGESDNNVHPANTLRLVDALIKANKRFDMIYLPGTRHAFGEYTPYTTQRTWEYFAQHLLGDYQPGADIYEKVGPPSHR